CAPATAALRGKRSKWVNQGIDQIDHALALLGPQYDSQKLRGVPISLETRLVAIATYVPLPSLFNRMSVARQQGQSVAVPAELAAQVLVPAVRPRGESCTDSATGV